MIVCCSNSQPHVLAVTKFLKFLEAKCNVCVVVVNNDCVMSAESVQDWLTTEIELANKIVLFHSEESVAMAWRFTKSATTNSTALKTFFTLLEMFSHSRVDPSKLVNVYFSYTPANCVVNINCGQTYQLMSEFDKFLANVRGSSGFDSSMLLRCDEGRELQRAIKEAAAYVEAHRNNYDSCGFLPPDPETDSIDTQSIVSRMAAYVGGNLSDFGLTRPEVLLTSEAEV